MKLLTAVLGFVIAATASITAQDPKGRLSIEPYTFENSKKETVEAELGKLGVPENRNDLKSRMIEIAFVRFKSTSPNPGPPIVYLAGGPGGSGIGAARGSRFPLFMKMREFGDVIALDQRGTGMSVPNLSCEGTVELPLDKPMTRKSLIDVISTKASECAVEWRTKGADLAGYNTLQNAHDIEDLRKALGAEKLRLWGISYGTHLGLTAIREFPGSFGPSVLAGIESMDDTLKLPKITSELIEELSLRVSKDEKFSKAVPDLKALIAEVLQKLEKEPVTVEVKGDEDGKVHKVTFGRFDVEFLLAQATGESEALSLFPALFLGMSKGNFDFLGQHVYRLRRRGLPSMMSIAMDCASGATEARLRMIETQSKGAVLGGVINEPYPAICSSVGIPDLGDDFRKPVVSDVPVLFISGTLDGRTPVSNAEAVIPGFRNSSHLIIDGAGHSDDLFLSSPKIEETMSSFFAGKDLPREMKIETAVPFAFRQP